MAAGKNTPTAYAGSDPYIFVSYAHKDSDKAFPFIAALQNYGYNVWFDDGIRFGKEWEEEIAEKLLGCSVFFFLVSERSLESSNCKDELSLARRKEKRFVNVLIEDIRDFPAWFDLRYMRYQDCRLFNFSSYDEAIEALSKKVNEMAATRSSAGADDEKQTTGTAKTDTGTELRTSIEAVRQTLAEVKLIKDDFKKGAFIKFGLYPQGANGEITPVEWIVLENDGEKALLLSRSILDCQPYHNTTADVTWETCYLRKWLNDFFFKNAFGAEEQIRINSTTVSPDKIPVFRFSPPPGNATVDRIFILSLSEAGKYFRSNKARSCAPTDYAKAKGARISSEDKTGGREGSSWWLRSPGNCIDCAFAACVENDGSIDRLGCEMPVGSVGVRPALWINLES
ncbi:MAG: toll/interleukin-1 receptor domain-containing protein [Clostridia bacterium]|nr:toll/interleukin-1 receptor domain-containing protein [Clostridia bacterium]